MDMADKVNFVLYISIGYDYTFTYSQLVMVISCGGLFIAILWEQCVALKVEKGGSFVQSTGGFIWYYMSEEKVNCYSIILVIV